MPVAVMAGIASVVAAAAVIYVRKKRAALQADDARVVERLDSIAVKDAMIGHRLFGMPGKTVRRF